MQRPRHRFALGHELASSADLEGRVRPCGYRNGRSKSLSLAVWLSYAVKQYFKGSKDPAWLELTIENWSKQKFGQGPCPNPMQVLDPFGLPALPNRFSLSKTLSLKVSTGEIIFQHFDNILTTFSSKCCWSVEILKNISNEDVSYRQILIEVNPVFSLFFFL